jgi:tetratricopeptide (TPR) repeat protein
MNLSALQLPPPANWQDFETLCCDLWKSIWHDLNAQKNGRVGQPQHGVDISGRPNEGDNWAGVQCKGKDNYSEKVLTQDELKTEIEKAKSFKPALSDWTIATSGPKDAAVEELARQITSEHLKEGLFTVHVWGWKDIVEQLDSHPDVVEKHYPQFGRMATFTAKKIDEIRERTLDILESESGLAASIDRLSNLTAILAEQKERTGTADDSAASAVVTEYQAELDYSKHLINTYRYHDCVAYLEALKIRIWSSAPPIIKFRLLTNIAAAKIKIDQNEEAARLFIEAAQYNPEDEKAITNLALANLLLGQSEDAIIAVKKALEKNPASGNAYSIYLQIPIPDSSLESALSKVPLPFRTLSEVAYVLGLIAHKNGNSEQAEYWFEVALKNDQQNTPDISGTLGGLLLESILKRQAVVTYEQLNQEQKSQVSRARDLLTAAWDRVASTDLRKSGLLWVANRGVAKKLLGDLKGAIQDLDIAVAEDPGNVHFIKHAAILAYLNGDTDRAVSLLTPTRVGPDQPEMDLILADVLSTANRASDAVDVLKSLLSRSDLTSEILEEANRELVGAYIKLGDLAQAAAVSNQMRSLNPTEILNLTDAAEIARLSGKRDEALAFLGEAKQYVTAKTSYKRLLILANEFHSIDEFGEAADIFERIANKDMDSAVTRRLLNSYYRFGKLNSALEICRNLRSRHGPLPFITHIESTIYEEIDDFGNARKVCEEFLRAFPADPEMKLRLAVVNWRDNRFEDLDAYLDSSPDILALPLQNALQLAHLYSLRHRVKDCFDTIYELRRKFYDRPEAHLEYVRLFFEQANQSYEWLSPKAVSSDVAVCVEDATGKKDWYVIEDRSDLDFRRGEISLAHRLAQRLLGKKAGEQVVLKEGLHEEEMATVTELKSKYLYALHETFEVYEKMFPDAGGLWMFHIGEPQQFGETPKGFKNILKSVSKQQERGSQVEQFYNEGKLSLGSIANLLHIDVIKVWNTLRSNPNVGIRCARGDAEERDNAYSLINNQPTNLVIDLISLLTIHGLQIADVFANQFGKFFIAQRSIEELQNFVREYKGLEGQGFMTIAKVGEQFVRTEVTEAEVQRTVEYFEGIVSWVHQNCVVVPVTGALDIPRERREPLTDMLGGSFLDTVLIAREKGVLLFSDDERLRSFAKSEYAVDGVWTQILLIFAHNKKLIQPDVYTEAVITLVCWHYYHTSIDLSVLLKAAKKAEWLTSYPYTEVVKILNGGRSDDESAIKLTSLFLYELWKQPILPNRRDYLIYSLLDSLTAGRDPNKIVSKLITRIRAQFFLLPLEVNRLVSLIQLWKQMHFL